jgi:hypothetical protein
MHQESQAMDSALRIKEKRNAKFTVMPGKNRNAKYLTV